MWEAISERRPNSMSLQAEEPSCQLAGATEHENPIPSRDRKGAVKTFRVLLPVFGARITIIFAGVFTMRPHDYVLSMSPVISRAPR
jgi:hypothetical protein